MKYTRHPLVYISVCLIFLAGFAAWGFGYIRRVDGRSAAQWLAMAQQAAHSVPYHAEGVVNTNGVRARFTLDQSRDGRYVMNTNAGAGCACTLGYDGKQLWYAAGDKRKVIESGADPREISVKTRSRILGTATVANRPAVCISADNGQQRKTLSIDRETGVVLDMTTTFRRQAISRMTVEAIQFRDVTLASRPQPSGNAARSVDDAALAKVLGENVVLPRWLPAGFTRRNTLVEKCGDCGMNMAVLHYSDGVSSLTLFEMSCRTMCAMGEGCHQTPGNRDLVATLTVGNLTVTAVGDVDSDTLHRILNESR